MKYSIGADVACRSRPVDFDLGIKYVQNSLTVDGPEMSRIQDAAAESSINVSLGFSERDGESVYIAQALIDDQGRLRMTRRKMKPTHMERTIFGDASGECLAKVINLSDVGRVGGLSCWEHIQPLLKYYTFSQGEQIHVAAWPPLDAFVQGSPGFYSMSIEGVYIKRLIETTTHFWQAAETKLNHTQLKRRLMCCIALQSSQVQASR